jgi:hypothetical protein
MRSDRLTRDLFDRNVLDRLVLEHMTVGKAGMLVQTECSQRYEHIMADDDSKVRAGELAHRQVPANERLSGVTAMLRSTFSELRNFLSRNVS